MRIKAGALVVALCASVAVAFAQVSSAQPDPSLVAYYPFNGNANDASGNGNNGTVFGATPTTDRFGAPNRAMAFDGIDDYIEVPDNGDSLDIADDFTIALWMRPATTSGFVLNKHLSGTNADGSWWLAQFPPFNFHFEATPFPGGPNPGASTSAPIPTGTWTFVALTYDDPTNAWQFYVNGIPDASGLFDFQIQNTLLRLLIGSDDPQTSFYAGDLDEIRIYKRVLSGAEISELFSDGDAPPSPPTTTAGTAPGGAAPPVAAAPRFTG